MRNLKRALSLALAAAMVIGMMVIGASAASTYDDFTDKDEIVNTEAVNTMVSLGVLAGKDDGSYFDPTGIVTRGEMAKIVAVCLNGGQEPVLGDSTNIPKFSDVPTTHWAYNYVAYCVQQGIIAGRGDGTFAPDEPVTGSAAAKMFLCALGYRADLEGLTGNEWEINTNILANQDAKLYEGLSGINASEGLSRDNTAQMAYNAVQAEEVTYNNLYGDYTGVLQTETKGTMLSNRFRVVKVTGILEANDKVSVATGVVDADGNRIGHTFGTTALDGKSLLRVTNVAGKETVNYSSLMGAQTFTVDTSDEMVGQEIVLYVRFTNELAPNASSSTVIGSPIITDNNTVVETSTRLKDDSAVRSALRAGGMTNIGTPVAILYTETDVQYGVNTGITDSVTAKLRADETDRSAGIFQRFIDNDGDGYPNYIVQIAPVLTTVNSVNTDSTKYTFTGISGTIDSDDIVTEETLVRNDVVLINKYADDCYYVSYPETVEGAIVSYNSNNDTVSVDGTDYANSGGKNLAVVTGQDQILTEEMVDGTYIFYLDPYGNVLGMLETEGVVGNYAVVQGWSRTGNANMGYSVSVKLLMQDGTTGTYNVNLAATAVRLGVATSTDSTKDKETAITTGNSGAFFGDPDATSPAEGGNVLDHLFSYTLDGNTVTLSYPQEVNDDRYMSSNWNAGALVQDDSLASGTTVKNNTATYGLTKAGTSIVANDQTVFFIKDKNGEYYVVTGLSKLPSNTTNITTGDTVGIPVDTTKSDTISYQAPGSDTWMARAVFLETTNAFESVRDFVFVTDKWVTKNVSGSPVYTFNVVNKDGEVSEMTTTQSANTLKNTVREWNYDGSYVEFHDGDGNFTYHNVFVSEIEGNVITLSDVDTGAVEGSFRVDGAAKIWDVQDDPVTDTLQVNDIVGVYLDSDNIVTAAFIYDVMNGAYAELPTSITLGGVALTGSATPVSATANQVLPLVVTVPTDVTLDSIKLGGTPITMTKSGSTYTGSYTATSTTSLSVEIVVSQPGRDDYTYRYAGTFDITVGGGSSSEDNIISFADFADPSNPDYNFYAGASNEPLTITNDRGPNSSVTVPAGEDLAIEKRGTAFVPGDEYQIGSKSYAVGDDECLVIPSADLTNGLTITFPLTKTHSQLTAPSTSSDIDTALAGGSATVSGAMPTGTINSGNDPIDLTLKDATVSGTTMVNGGIKVEGTVTVGSTGSFETSQVDVASGATFKLENGGNLTIQVLNVAAGGKIAIGEFSWTANTALYIDFSAGTINGDAATFTPGDGLIGALQAANAAGFFA